MKTVLIDHNDSFTYNIVETMKQIGLTELTVINHKDASLKIMESFDKIILSPGPSIASIYQNSIEIVAKFHKSKPILGICLGHQLLAAYFGATLENLPIVNHGAQETIFIKDKSILFDQIENCTKVGLYHSWCVSNQNFPNELLITSTLENGLITSLEHKKYPVYGIQFHPESFLSEDGKQLLTNFLNLSHDLNGI